MSSQRSIYLPNEMLYYIFWHLHPSQDDSRCARQTLLSASLTSTQWHSVASPVLYHTYVEDNIHNFRLFLRTIVTNAYLASHVRTLRFPSWACYEAAGVPRPRLSPEQKEDYTTALETYMNRHAYKNENEAALFGFKDVRWGNDDSELLLLLLHCTKLDCLDLWHRGCIAEHPSWPHVTTALDLIQHQWFSQMTTAFTSITALSISCPARVLPSLFSLPSLISLQIFDLQGEEDIQWTRGRSSRVRTLAFFNFKISLEHIDEAVLMCQSLESFHLSFHPSINTSDHQDLNHVIRALQPRSSSLISLSLTRGAVDSYWAPYPERDVAADTNMEGLSSFMNLRDLTLHFLAVESSDMNSGITQLLPPNLEYLRLDTFAVLTYPHVQTLLALAEACISTYRKLCVVEVLHTIFGSGVEPIFPNDQHDDHELEQFCLAQLKQVVDSFKACDVNFTQTPVSHNIDIHSMFLTDDILPASYAPDLVNSTYLDPFDIDWLDKPPENEDEPNLVVPPDVSVWHDRLTSGYFTDLDCGSSSSSYEVDEEGDIIIEEDDTAIHDELLDIRIEGETTSWMQAHWDEVIETGTLSSTTKRVADEIAESNGMMNVDGY